MSEKETEQNEELTTQEQAELDALDQRRAEGFKMTPAQRRRNRKYQQEFRDREKEKLRAAGFSSPAEEKLRSQWQQNRAALTTEQNAALLERRQDFQFIRGQIAAVIARVRRGIHPDVEAPGRFYDCVAEEVLDIAKKYGFVEFLPAEILFLAKPSEIESMKTDRLFHYRMTLGLDVDGLSNLEYLDFFEYFFKWYLAHRDDPAYDYDWAIADTIYDTFEIPKKFLTGIFARPSSIWTSLHRRRTLYLLLIRSSSTEMLQS